MSVVLVDTVKKLDLLVSEIHRVKKCAVDTESTGLHLLKDRIITIPITCDGVHYVIPIRLLTQKNLPVKTVARKLKPVLRDKSIVKYFWNFKYDQSMLSNDGMRHIRNIEDGMVLAWLLDENRSKSLKERCLDVDLELNKFPFNEYFKLRDSYTKTLNTVEVCDPGRCPTLKSVGGDREALAEAKEKWRAEKEAFRQYKKEVKPITEKGIARLKEMENELIVYAGEDTLATHALCDTYLPRIKREEPRLYEVYRKVWRPFLYVLYNMERTGYAVDEKYLDDCEAKCNKQIADLEKEVFRIAGKPFKIQGPELANLLFYEMGCPVLNYTKKGAPSADKDTLELLSREPLHEKHPYGTSEFKPLYPILEPLVKLKKLKKMKDTYLSPDSSLRKALHKSKIHPHYDACGTKTGRLSSSNINFQQIPQNNELTFNFRNCFIAPAGRYLGVYDWSQIELRMIADRTGDKTMVQAYLNDEDIHHTTGKGVGLDPEKDRKIAKNLNFGAFYGIFYEKFSTILTVNTGTYVSPEQSQDYLEAFFRLYSEVPQYQKYVFKQVRQKGYATSLIGRKRRLPEIYSHKNFERSRAERQGFNFKIQGSVADMMNVCMVRISRDPWFRKNRIYLIAQVHDEIHLSVPCYICPRLLLRKVKKIFENPFEGFKFKVPIKLEGNSDYAFSWGDAK